MTVAVVLPGMDGTGMLLADFAAALKPELEPIVVSYPADRPYGYPELEAIAREALPQHGAFVMVAESFSGPIAVAIAASRPQGLRGLVLCCSFVRNPVPATRFLDRFLNLLPMRLAMPMLDWLLLGRFSSEMLRTALRGALDAVSPVALRARLKAVLRVDARPELARVEVPVLYIRASEDRMIPLSAQGTIADVSPQLRVEEVIGPHFLLQVAPSAAAECVKGFVRDLG